jgi:hypothetical protein
MDQMPLFVLFFTLFVNAFPVEWTAIGKKYSLDVSQFTFVEDLMTIEKSISYCQDRCHTNNGCAGYAYIPDNALCLDKSCVASCGYFALDYVPMAASQDNELDAMISIKLIKSDMQKRWLLDEQGVNSRTSTFDSLTIAMVKLNDSCTEDPLSAACNITKPIYKSITQKDYFHINKYDSDKIEFGPCVWSGDWIDSGVCHDNFTGDTCGLLTGHKIQISKEKKVVEAPWSTCQDRPKRVVGCDLPAC